MNSPYICSICFNRCEGWGNNAAPVNAGRCCDECNAAAVIPARIRLMIKERLWAEKANNNAPET